MCQRREKYKIMSIISDRVFITQKASAKLHTFIADKLLDEFQLTENELYFILNEAQRTWIQSGLKEERRLQNPNPVSAC